MSEIKFRKIIKEDLADVFLLLNQLKEKDINTIDSETAWKNFKSNSSSNSIVGIYNDRVLAYGSIVIENKIRGDIAGHVEDIVVDDSMRGKMVGVKLINKLINIGSEKGCYRITLFCEEKLIKFYERTGFKVNNIMMKKFL
ncbi:MAG: GNAT family N-acetyltransferase [Cytophagales bacterium]|nr:GNAT family N-acetyltransferase [Cytophagales bacterium]